MELSVGNLIIGGGILATALGLLVEQTWRAIAEWKFHKAKRRRLRRYLKGWHADTLAYLTKIEQEGWRTCKEWKQYKDKMELIRGDGEIFPWLPYHRFLLPDIGPTVTTGLEYLSESAYANLLYLTGRVRLIDERNAHFCQFLYDMLQTDLSAATRAKAAKLIVGDIEWFLRSAEEAKQYARSQGLLEWLAD